MAEMLFRVPIRFWVKPFHFFHFFASFAKIPRSFAPRSFMRAHLHPPHLAFGQVVHQPTAPRDRQ